MEKRRAYWDELVIEVLVNKWELVKSLLDLFKKSKGRKIVSVGLDNAVYIYIYR